MKKIGIRLLKVYAFTWIFILILYVSSTLYRSVSWEKLISSFVDAFTSKQGLLLIHSTFLLFLLLFSIFKYFSKLYKKRGAKVFLKQFLLRLVVPIVGLIMIISTILERNRKENFEYTWNHSVENNTGSPKRIYEQDSMIRGMSVYNVGRNRRLNMNQLIKSNIEWLAVIPYFYQKDEQTKSMNQPEQVGVWSKRDSLFIKDIEGVRKKGFFVMLKPHLWMSSGWRANINFKTKKDWNTWFDGYRQNILHYAMMAQKTGAELFCIGTELESSWLNIPERWIDLVREIKTIYEGKLTYAANWNASFTQFPVWKELDFIGIQAYFPLTEGPKPELSDIKLGWDKHIEQLKGLSKQYNRPILFTEIGYRNDLYATVRPWEWESFFKRLYKKKSNKTQQLAYQAMFEKCWDAPWFAGVFPWEWNSSDFPIYGQPAQNTMAIWYAK